MLDFINLHKYYGMPSFVNEAEIPRVPFYEQFSYCESNLDRVLESDSFARLKRRFMENKKDPYDPAYYNVVVHVRRPKSHDCRLNGTDTPDEYYLNIIKTIRDEHLTEGGKPLRFHIYSQGGIS